jgi:hypothetical protein
MPEDVQVSCIIKHPTHYDPHTRIKELGGMHNGQYWHLPEATIITELEKPLATRRWNFFTNVNDHRVSVVIAEHEGRKYLKTQPDKHPENNLLNLADCPQQT